jgi:hypothetical protein
VTATHYVEGLSRTGGKLRLPSTVNPEHFYIGSPTSSQGCSNCHYSSTPYQDNTSNNAHNPGPGGGCPGCHATGSSTIPQVNQNSPHADLDGNTGTTECTKCHPGAGSEPLHTGGANFITLENDGRIDRVYSSHGGVFLRKYGSSTTEAQTCWNCHADTNRATTLGVPGASSRRVSEWEDTGDETHVYKFGTISTQSGTQSWLGSATWTSTNFGTSKANLDIKSTHDTNLYTGENPIATASMMNTTETATDNNIGCSRCHAVHGKMKTSGGVVVDAYPVKRFTPTAEGGTWADSAKVYLRGIFYSSPYAEDGPPSSTANITSIQVPNTWGVASTAVGPNFVAGKQGVSEWTDHSNVASNFTSIPPFVLSGVHIDENAYGSTGFYGYNSVNSIKKAGSGATLNTVTHYSYDNASATDTQLCMRCHGDLTTLTGLWPGHASVKGATATAGVDNIFTPEMAINQHYQYNNIEMGCTAWATNIGYSGDLASTSSGWGSGSYYNWAIDLCAQVGTMTPSAINTSTEARSATGTDKVNRKYHQFTCSKCHSPHASANARLMVTNCMNRDGVSGANTFNMREGGPGLIVGDPATKYQNIVGFVYPSVQNNVNGMSTIRDYSYVNQWITDDQGHSRTVQCHNNQMQQPSSGTPYYWQSIN